MWVQMECGWYGVMWGFEDKRGISFCSFPGDGCGHTVLGPESGTLASINYPRTSPNSTVCEWEIRVKPGQRVQLKFGDFDIDDSDSCHSSYLRVHNGIGPNRTEIGRSFNYYYLRTVVLYRGGMYWWYFCSFNNSDMLNASQIL